MARMDVSTHCMLTRRILSALGLCMASSTRQPTLSKHCSMERCQGHALQWNGHSKMWRSCGSLLIFAEKWKFSRRRLVSFTSIAAFSPIATIASMGIRHQITFLRSVWHLISIWLWLIRNRHRDQVQHSESILANARYILNGIIILFPNIHID